MIRVEIFLNFKSAGKSNELKNLFSQKNYDYDLSRGGINLFAFGSW